MPKGRPKKTVVVDYRDFVESADMHNERIAKEKTEATIAERKASQEYQKMLKYVIELHMSSFGERGLEEVLLKVLEISLSAENRYYVGKED
jgi:hypothetical protein